MNTKKTSKINEDSIFSLTFSVKMANIANVLTYARFCKESGNINVVSEPDSPYGNQNNSENYILFIDKSWDIASNVSGFIPTKKTGYALYGTRSNLLYLNYYLNTFLGKSKLSSKNDITDKDKQFTTNLSLIKNLQVLRNSKIEPYCIYLQQVNNRIDLLLDESRMDIQSKSAIIRCFKTIADSIVFEMILPEAFAKYKVSVVEDWIKLVNSVSSEDNFDMQIHLLIRDIFKINSPILDSINRMKTFGPQIAISLLETAVTETE